jgi:hypothetical protein
MRETKYILDNNKNPVPEPDVIKWVHSMEPSARRVQENTVNGYWISTVFLGLDHQHGDGPPLVFETMAFPQCDDGKLREDYCERYSTWDEAVAGHNRAVTLYQNKQQETNHERHSERNPGHIRGVGSGL